MSHISALHLAKAQPTNHLDLVNIVNIVNLTIEFIF